MKCKKTTFRVTFLSPWQTSDPNPNPNANPDPIALASEPSLTQPLPYNLTLPLSHQMKKAPQSHYPITPSLAQTSDPSPNPNTNTNPNPIALAGESSLIQP
jgi:hypothetical protein